MTGGAGTGAVFGWWLGVGRSSLILISSGGPWLFLESLELRRLKIEEMAQRERERGRTKEF